MDGMRLNKYLAHCGVCSRREADRLIGQGKVLVNGMAPSPGQSVCGSDIVSVSGQVISNYKKTVVLAFYKPVGVTCTEKDAHAERIISDIVRYPFRVTYAGRLDKDSEGLLLLTNDGPLAHRLLAPKSHVDKVYYVEVDGALDQDDVLAAREGMTLGDGTVCLPAELELLSSNSAHITLREGKYHQVKRMMASRGKPVAYLKRVRFGPLRLDEGLAKGEWRPLTREERESVFRA